MPMTWDALTKASIPMTSDGLAQDRDSDNARRGGAGYGW